MDKDFSIPRRLYVESPWLVNDQLDWRELTRGTKPVFYPKDRFVRHQNQPDGFVYIVHRGRVNLSIINTEGKTQGLFVRGEGTLFGEIPAFLAPDNCAQAMAVGDSYLYKVEQPRYQSAMNTSHTIALNTAHVLAQKIRVLTSHIEGMSFSDALCRIADMLAYLAKQYGKPGQLGPVIQLRFTHQNMADMIGASRVTTTNALRLLATNNIVRKTGGLLEITNYDKLREFTTNL